MSQNNESFGYGKDVGYEFNSDGSVDFAISDSGDLLLVGGDSDDSISLKRQNARQQILLRIITPFGSLQNHEGQTVPFGSEIPSMIGAKDTELNKRVMQAYVLSCLQGYQALEAILAIDVEFPSPGVSRITLKIKLKDDDEILFETIDLSGA